jgi:hypothetical protein
MAKADLGDKALEPRPPLCRSAGATEIIVNDRDPGPGPAKTAGMIDKPVLDAGRLPVLLQLLQRRLPDVDDRLPVKVAREDLARERGSIRGT